MIALRISGTGILCLISALCLQPAGTRAADDAQGGKVRTYYVAADEVNWDYAPSGRDEAMGMPVDPIAKTYTEPGPHQIGRVNEKAVYREYTDAKFTTLKPRWPPSATLTMHTRPTGMATR